MVIADSFVFLHPPKTGGSFVTEVLTEIYASHAGGSIANVDKHGGFDRIPVEHHSKQVVTTIRNPFDYYVSHFQFGYWIDREADGFQDSYWDECQAKSHFPNYPYLRFEEFISLVMELGHQRLPREEQELVKSLRLGPLTIRALEFSVPKFLQLLRRFAATGDIVSLTQAVRRTRFLHTERLNVDTHNWLLDLGVPGAAARAVLLKPPVQPLNTPRGVILKFGHGQPRHLHWSTFFTARTQALVLEREWLFLKMFPEYSTAELCPQSVACSYQSAEPVRVEAQY